MAEKYADLRIRARDEFSKVLISGEKALDRFIEKASRKEMLGAAVAQRQAVKGQIQSIEALKKQYSELEAASKSNYSRQMAVDMVNLRDKIYKTKDALNEQLAVLQKVRGVSFGSWSKNMDEVQKKATAAVSPLERLRARVDELRAAQDAAAAGAKRYLSNQSQANRIGPSFGSTNAALGRKFADEAKSLKRDIAGLEAQMTRMKGATQGSFAEFSKRATDLQKTADASKKATSGLGALSEAEKKLAAASRATENSRERAARMATELRASQDEIIAKFGAESAEARKLTAALAVLDAKAQGLKATQKGLGDATNAAAGAMRNQSGAGAGKGSVPGKGRKSGQNWGSDVIGEDQEVMAFGLKPYQLTNLGYQVNDVVSGIAMGQPILQIFAQQIGQITQIFPAAARGMMGFFQILERAPARAGLVGAALAVVGAAIFKVGKESADARNALTGADKLLTAFGDSASYSVERIAQAARGMQEISGSIESALELAQTFSRAGIRTDRFEELATVAAKLSSLTGGELPDMAKQLSEAFSGGFDSLREFDKELNIFTAAELAAIRTMYDAGNAAGAQELAFDALQAKMKDTSDTAKGPWSRAFSALGSAWDTLVESLSNSIVIIGLAEAFDVLAGSVEGAANLMKMMAGSNIFKVATGDFSPIFGEQEKSVDILTVKIARMKEVLAEYEASASESSAVWNWFNNTGDIVDSLKEKLREAEFELEKLQTGSDAGLTLTKVEELQKAYGDYSAEIAKANKARSEEAATAGMSTRQVEIETSKREALNKALASGLNQLPHWVDLWKKEAAAIEESVNAKHDAIDAAERLKEAQELVAGAVEDNRSEQEELAAQIKELEDALAEMAAAGLKGSEAYIEGQKALALLRKEAESAATPFSKLGELIPSVSAEMERLNKLAEINKLEKEALAAAKTWEDFIAVLIRARQAREAVDASTKDAAYYEEKYSMSRFNGSGAGGGSNLDGLGINSAQAEELVRSVAMVAQELGISAKDLLTAMSYETGGKLDPWMAGPTTQWGQHRGLIQWGEPQREKYGVTESSTITDQVIASGKYLTDAGVKAGDGLLQIYAAINAGDARKVGASDAANGGAPGTVTDKVNSMGQHAAKADGLLAAYQGVAVASAEVVENDQKRAEAQEDYLKDLDTSLTRIEYENSLRKLGDTEREIALAIYDETIAAEEKGLVLGEARKRQIADLIRGRNQERDAQKEVADAEQRVSDIMAQRQALEGQLEIAETNGDQGKAAQLKQEIADLNVELLAAIEKSRELTATLGGAGADAAVAKMETLKLKTQEYGREAGVTAGQINNMVGGAASGAINEFAQSLAEGEGFVKSLGDAFRKFASDTLIQIGQLIVQLTIMNALKNSGMGGGIAGMLNGFVGVAHTGGMIGSGISQRRAVNPSIFAAATRYHTGGVIGLKPNERPIIAKVGEEMLTEDDPRHRRNGGGAAAGVTIINAVDGADAIEQGLATPNGQDAVVNHMRSNRAKYRAALGI